MENTSLTTPLQHTTDGFGIETGLLEVFRMYSLLRIFVVTIIYTLATYLLVGGILIETLQTIGVGLIGGVALLVYLSSPALHKRLKKIYLPLGLILATLDALMVEKLLSTGIAFLPIAPPANMTFTPFNIEIAHLSPPLFVILILVSWQYPFRIGLLFAITTGMVDLLYFLLTDGIVTSSIWLTITGILPRTASLILISLIVTRLVRVQRQQRQQLVAANAQIASYASTLESLAISRERNRMARELHDTLAHTLSASSVQLEAIDALMTTNPDKAKVVLGRAMDVTRNGLQETRRALHALRAAPLEDLGLSLALEDLVENIQPRTSAQIQVHIPASLPQFPEATEQMIYRISQEALENAARHAHAKCISMTLTTTNTKLDLYVEDDGVGFVQEAVNRDEHFGITGMIERAQALGGHLNISSAPQQGTHVHLSIGV